MLRDTSTTLAALAMDLDSPDEELRRLFAELARYLHSPDDELRRRGAHRFAEPGASEYRFT